MGIIYKIIGGGQRVIQNTQQGISTEFVKDENSDWSQNSQCEGQDLFTNTMWSVDLNTLQEWANRWAGQEVELIECKNE